MAIQHRRGAYSNFDKSRLVPGEIAVVLSGDSTHSSDGATAYINFNSSTTKRIAFMDDIQAELDNAVNSATDRAETAASTAETAASELSDSTAQITSNKQNIEDLNNFVIASSSNIDGTFSIGGVNTSTGKTNNATNRARLGYTTVESGKLYSVQLNSDSYSLLNAWLYTSDNENSAVRNLTDSIKNGRYVNFMVGQDEAYIRLTVKHADSDDTITNEDITAITSAVKLVELTDTSLTKKGLPADAYETGQTINTVKASLLNNQTVIQNTIEKLLPSYEIDWKKFAQTESPLGWGIGYYNATTGAANSSSKSYIRTRNRLDIDLISENTIMCSVTPPNGYYVLVCVSNKSDNSFVETFNTDRVVDKTITFQFDPTKRYGFTIGLFENEDSNNYVTAEFISQIKLVIYEKAKATRVFNSNNLSVDYIWDSTLEYALLLPPLYEPIGEPTKMIICGHGLSSTISSSSWGAKNVSTALMNNGYAVMDVNQVTTQDWCNPALIKKYIAALKDITQKYNVVPTFIYGYSMGSLIALALSTVVSGIKASVISGIRLDLLARYNEATAEDKAIIDSNLGFTDGFDYNKIAGWCKTAFSCLSNEQENMNPIQFPPTLFLYGTSDTLTQEESLAKIAEIKRGGTICDIKEYNAAHGAMCALTAGTSFEDTIEWFDIWG